MEGRPIPSSSIFLTSDASEKRGGGWVKCWSATTSPRRSGSRSAIGGSMRLSSSLFSSPAALSSWASRYSFRKPSKARIEPVARSRGPFGVAGSAISTVTWSSSADCIWLATARFQISSYSLRCSGLRYRPTRSGVSETSVGRIASCASWAFLALLLYSRAAPGR